METQETQKAIAEAKRLALDLACSESEEDRRRSDVIHRVTVLCEIHHAESAKASRENEELKRWTWKPTRAGYELRRGGVGVIAIWDHGGEWRVKSLADGSYKSGIVNEEQTAISCGLMGEDDRVEEE